MGKNVVILEFIDEVEAFLKYCKKNNLSSNNFLIIALQPSVQVFLKKLGISYENTIPYLPNESHVRILLKSEEWIQFLKSRLALKDGKELNETYNNTFLFYTRLYIIHFIFDIEILCNIFKKHKVDSIFACVYTNDISPHDPPVIQDSERFIGAIAKIFSETKGVLFTKIPVCVVKKETKNLKTKNSPDQFREFSEAMISKFFRILWKNYLKGKKVILLASSGYNVGKMARNVRTDFPDVKWVLLSGKKPSFSMATFLAERLLSKDQLDIRIPVKILEENSATSRYGSILEKLIDTFIEDLEGELSEHFFYEEVNFVDFFSEKIRKDLKPFLLMLCRASLSIKDIISSLEIKLLISPFARERALMIAELCRNRGIPALLVSHGTVVEPKNKSEEIELFHMGETLDLSNVYTHVAIQTPLQADHHSFYKPMNTPIITGNLIFSKVDLKRKMELKEKLVGKENMSKKILLYPESTRPRCSTRAHFSQTFDEFVQSISSMLIALDNLEGVHLVVRLHPGIGNGISTEELKSLLPYSKNLTILKGDTPFSDVLAIADLVINFSSTVIEDALQNKIPVILYDNTKRYKHIKDAQKLGENISPKLSAVYYIESSSYLIKGLKWIYSNHLNSVNLPESLFDKYIYDRSAYSTFIKFISDAVST